MYIIPAIDLLGGKCVRLYKGDYNKSQTYSTDPVEMALSFEKIGAKLIHLVDLDAAREDGNNRKIIKKICSKTNVTIEVGGGIRTKEDVKELFEAGVKRLIIGTLLIRNPKEVEKWIKEFTEIDFIAGIDALNGEVKVSGWEEGSGISDSQLAKNAAKMGCKGIIYTNIDKDGTLEGADIENSARISKTSTLPLIVSGGVSCSSDIKAIIDSENSGFWGIITGKAIYEGKLDLKDVISKYQTVIKKDVCPLIIKTKNGTILDIIHMNTKGFRKSIENNVLWVLKKENGKLLPYSKNAPFLNLKDRNRWYEAEVSPSFVVEIVDNCSQVVDNVDNCGKNGDNSLLLQNEEFANSILGKLEQVIHKRKIELPEGSYTTHLFKSGAEKIRKKTGEEAIELILASSKDEIIYESADLIYHMMVLLESEEISFSSIIKELAKRD